jgi:hypothetical protein
LFKELLEHFPISLRYNHCIKAYPVFLVEKLATQDRRKVQVRNNIGASLIFSIALKGQRNKWDGLLAMGILNAEECPHIDTNLLNKVLHNVDQVFDNC